MRYRSTILMMISPGIVFLLNGLIQTHIGVILRMLFAALGIFFILTNFFRWFEIGSEELRIHNLWGNKCIPWTKIEQIHYRENMLLVYLHKIPFEYPQKPNEFMLLLKTEDLAEILQTIQRNAPHLDLVDAKHPFDAIQPT